MPIYLLRFFFFFLLFLCFLLIQKIPWGKFFILVNTPRRLASFTAKYRIPNDVDIRHHGDKEVAENRGHIRVVIPLIAFLEG